MVPVKIDVDKQEAVYKKYKEPPTPTIMFLDPKGNVLHSVTGFQPPDAFLVEMKRALGKSAGAHSKAGPQAAGPKSRHG